MDEALLQTVDGLLQVKSDQNLRHLLSKEDAREIADVIDALENGKRKTFVLLQPELQAKVVKLLSASSLDSILPRLPDSTVARFCHFLAEDDATDIIQHLPKRQQHILQFMDEDRRKRIEKLLMFGAETAGGLMDLNFITVAPETTVQEVIEIVRNYTHSHTQVPVIFLQTPKETRWVTTRSLISAQKNLAVSHVSKPVPEILHTVDREVVLDLLSRESGDVVSVIDENRHMLGVIHVNDLLRIAEAEASEDAYRMGAVGSMDTSYLESGFGMIWRKRVGWLSVLFVAELFTFTALSRFEASIEAVTALALFVPLCISTGGNSGSQAATLITRAMALGHVATFDWWRVLRRELLMGIALGLALGAVGFLRASATPRDILANTDRLAIGLVIGSSVAAICVWGTLVGSMLPLVFKKLGFDPAFASSPFVATFVDVTGIVIYFSIANAVIL